MLCTTGVPVVGTPSTKSLGVREQDSEKLALLLVNLYSSAVTPVRELIVNALEVTEPGSDPVEVTFDRTLLDKELLFGGSNSDNEIYTISVEDHGCGMSHQFASDVFTNLLASSKDGDVNAIGGFGLGSKGIMAISSHATWRTVKDGVATVIVMRPGTSGVDADISAPVKTTDPNGTKVTAIVDRDTYRTVLDNIGTEFLNYLDPSTPIRIIISGTDITSYTVGSSLDGLVRSGDIHFDATTPSYVYRVDNTNSRIRVQGMPYPIPNQIDIREMWQKVWQEVWQGMTGNSSASFSPSNMVIDLDPSKVVIQPNREQVLANSELSTEIRRVIIDSVTAYLTDHFDTIRSTTDPVQYVNLVQRHHKMNNSTWNYYLMDSGTLNAMRAAISGKSVLVWGSEGNDEEENLNFAHLRSFMELTMENLHTLLGSQRATSLYNLAKVDSTVDDFLGFDTHGATYTISRSVDWASDLIRPTHLEGADRATVITWLTGAKEVTFLPRTASALRTNLMRRGGAVSRRMKKSGDTLSPNSAPLSWVENGELRGGRDVRPLSKEVEAHDLKVRLVSDIPTPEQDEILRSEFGILAVHADTPTRVDRVRERFGHCGTMVTTNLQILHCRLQNLVPDMPMMYRPIIRFAPGMVVSISLRGIAPSFYNTTFADGRTYLDRIAAINGVSDTDVSRFREILDLITTHTIVSTEIDDDGDRIERSVGNDIFINGAIRGLHDDTIWNVLLQSYGSHQADLSHQVDEGEVVKILNLSRTIVETLGDASESVIDQMDSVLTVTEKIQNGALGDLVR